MISKTISHITELLRYFDSDSIEARDIMETIYYLNKIKKGEINEFFS